MSPFATKIWKYLLVKVNIKKSIWNMCRQLKYHHHRIRSKTGISLAIILNIFKCVKVSLVSLKFLLLAIAPFLFILIGVLCEFAMVSGVYILLSPQEKEVHYSSWGNRCTHSAAYSSKRFKPLFDIMWLCQGYWWIGKNTSKEFSCVMVFIS